MEKVDSRLGIFVLDVSQVLAKQKFGAFKDLRKEAYQYIKSYREQFVKLVLNKHGVKYDESMSKRQIHELFQENIIGIIKDDKKNYDKIYKEGNLIAYWNRDIELFFDKRGHLMCRVQYKVY
jgi:GTPase involved in cell partitioning and DNA repair